MDLDHIERERLRLELQVAKLEQSLRTWQLWEAEYEGLREEIDALPLDASDDQLLNISTTFGGDVVTETEIRDLLGADQTRRPPSQVSALLSRRLDYTQQNVTSITRQLDAAREKLEPAGSILDTGLKNEQGEGMSEIIEELDDNDRVISSRICDPSHSTNDILETLKKSGLSETVWANEAESSGPSKVEPVTTTATPASREKVPSEKPQRKSVSFAEGTKLIDNAGNVPGSVASPAISQLAKGSFGADEKVWELDENDRPVDFTSPHIPANESPEDAALRRQMLQYNMSEIGAVVAELDLEEAGSSDEMYDEDDDTEEDDSDIEEDEHGISKYSVISDGYRDEMKRLEEKLNAQMLHNVGPADHSPETSGMTATLQDTPAGASTESAKPPTGAKSVRFANQPDRAPVQDKSADHGTRTAVNDVTERSGSNGTRRAQQPAPKKVSRFKAELSAAGVSKGASQLVQKKDTPMAETVVERPVGDSTNVAAPPDADELHPEQLRREVAQDYYRQRNNLIRRQGGFLQEDQLDEREEDVDEDVPIEGQKKVSRFKAARVQPDKIW